MGLQPTVILVPNGFQDEYTIGFANGLVTQGVLPVLVTSDSLQVERLHTGVRPVNLRGSQDPRRGALRKVLNILRYAWRLSALLVRQRATVHLIGLFTLPWALAGLVEALLLRALAVRFVMTVHNLLPHDKHTNFNRRIYGWIYRIPHRLVVHTNRMRDELISRFDITPEHITVMEHGIDRLMPLDSLRRDDMRNQLGVCTSDCLLVFFGNLAPYKGLDVLLDAWSALPPGLPACLLIAGRCRDAMLRSELLRRLAALPDPARVQWHEGFVPAERVPAYFDAADLVVMPYRHIDQSGVVFMAMSHGLPVLATDVGSLRDYVKHTGGAVVPPGDASALADRLSAMIRAYNCENALGRRAAVLERARGFLWGKTTAPVVELYREPLGA